MLDTTWVNEEIVLQQAGNVIAGRITANWATIKVTLHTDWPGVSWYQVSRGVGFACCVSKDPELAYTREGVVTARGRALGGELLACLHARCLVVAANKDAIAQRLEEFRCVRGQHAQIREAEREPLLQRRRQIKADLVAGRITNKVHQSLCMPLNEQLGDINWRDTQARDAAAASLRQWCSTQLGMPIEVDFLQCWFNTIVA